MASKSILVTGDFILDHHIYEGRRHHYGQSPLDGVKVKPQLGGAALVQQLLTAVLRHGDTARNPDWQVHLAVEEPKEAEALCRLDPSEHAYAFWRPYPTKGSAENRFWRVSEAMGFGSSDRSQACDKWRLASRLPARPEIAVLCEGGMGFRECSDYWFKNRLVTTRWIVLKTTAPLSAGKLWQHLIKRHREKLIVVVSARELRKSAARLNAGLSWEATIEDLMRELGPDGSLCDLTQCRHLIVAFESEGALWLDFGNSQQSKRSRLVNACAHLVFDAGSIEGEHAHSVDGTGFGFLSCLAAAVTWQLTFNLERPDLQGGLEGGLSAMRDLREKGHGPANEAADGFPAKRLSEVIKHPTFRYSRVTFAATSVSLSPRTKASRSPVKARWSLLRQAQGSDGPAYDLARLALLRGPIALQNLPHLRIGKMMTVDRAEVEALRTLVQVVRRYQKQDEVKKPLSIGVFGPPGAGKSFAVREIAENMVHNGAWLEFNLSQFNTSEDLNGAFHQIRDKVLQGKLPVAFFDEFDSRSYKWLQFLLAPMQDGKFQEGPLTHSLGKCIFVFAGATSWTFETFGPPKPPDDLRHEHQHCRDFRLAKGPDFHSRLDAYLNVVGPNQRQVSPPPANRPDRNIVVAGGHTFGTDPDDIYFPIRRALMSRVDLKCTVDEQLDLDEGFVHALLRAETYTHGSRSMSKILQPILAAKPGPLHRSLLMPAAQLDMHTDAKRFLQLLGDVPQSLRSPKTLGDAEVKAIAVAIHEIWRELSRRQGELKKERDVVFDQETEFRQSSSCAAAQRIPEVLSIVGLSIVRGRATSPEQEAVRQHIEHHLELLADEEHKGWMKWHLAQGWRYNPKRDDDKQLHNCLLPFSKLKDNDKNKDREQVRHYVDFLAGVGWKIVANRAP